MHLIIAADYETASHRAAGLICEAINAHDVSRPFVLGLPPAPRQSFIHEQRTFPE